MKIFILCLVSIFPLSSMAMDSYDELTQQQMELLKKYKKAIPQCKKPSPCLKEENIKMPNLLQIEANLKLMTDDLIRIQNDLK